jgi:hypothetical protein
MEVIEILNGVWRLHDDDGDAVHGLWMLEAGRTCSPLGEVANQY